MSDGWLNRWPSQIEQDSKVLINSARSAIKKELLRTQFQKRTLFQQIKNRVFKHTRQKKIFY